MKTMFCLMPALLLLAFADARALLERRSLAEVAPNGAAAATPWNGDAGLKCVGWRKTLTCVPSGPRDAMNDKDCLTIVASEESGFCECEGYVHTAAVPCGHSPVNCTKECGILQNLHREKFAPGSAGTPVGGNDDENWRQFATGSQAMNVVAQSKDPYANALKYGTKAVQNVNRAMTNSNELLNSARHMISKMMDLKPWAQIAQMGKDAEEAGKKSQELSKLARPFIYAQVDSDNSDSTLGHKNLRAAPEESTGVMNMLLKSTGDQTEEFAKGCLQVTQAMVAESDGKKKSVASQLSLVCSGLQLPLDVDLCQRYRSTLLSHLKKDAQWNMAHMDYPLFCTGMGEVAAEQKQQVIDKITSNQEEKAAHAAKEAAVAADIAAMRAHWPTKKPTAEQPTPGGLQSEN